MILTGSDIENDATECADSLPDPGPSTLSSTGADSKQATPESALDTDLSVARAQSDSGCNSSSTKHEQEQPKDSLRRPPPDVTAEPTNNRGVSAWRHASSALTTSIGSTADASLIVAPCNCFSWSRRRTLVALVGCTSSALVCTVRLVLDAASGGTTYFIHSIVILLDMVLIHLFTFSPWLSVTGELVTVISLLLFHYTFQTVFELIETTLIAALCSLHMIFSRNRHWDREEELEESLVGLKIQVRQPLREGEEFTSSGIEGVRHDEGAIGENRHHAERNDGMDSEGAIAEARHHGGKHDEEMDLKHMTLSTKTTMSGMVKPETKCCACGHHFFEHFLDGSAGVMYTSFVGLIVDEFIRYGSGGKNSL